jgi:ribosomal protein L3 glutamine methyltransferase
LSRRVRKTSKAAKTRGKPPPRLPTVGDLVRHAEGRFAKSKLAFGQGTHGAREEAIFLVYEALGLPVHRVAPFLARRVSAAERERVVALIERRVRERIPAAYLLGCAYLQGLRFRVDERVIVPRSYLAELLNSDLFAGDRPLIGSGAVTRVLDLCTGSGCLAVLACHVFPNAQVDAVDMSSEALQVAEINVAAHGLKDRIRLLRGDLFAPVGEAVYDLIVTNPPYVDAPAMVGLPREYAREPAMALAGGPDGLDIVRRILREAPRHLSPRGGLLCEVGRGRAILERDYPDKGFLWLDTEESSGEVFWIGAAELGRARPRAKA